MDIHDLISEIKEHENVSKTNETIKIINSEIDINKLIIDSINKDYSLDFLNKDLWYKPVPSIERFDWYVPNVILSNVIKNVDKIDSVKLKLPTPCQNQSELAEFYSSNPRKSGKTLKMIMSLKMDKTNVVLVHSNKFSDDLRRMIKKHRPELNLDSVIITSDKNNFKDPYWDPCARWIDNCVYDIAVDDLTMICK